MSKEEPIHITKEHRIKTDKMVDLNDKSVEEDAEKDKNAKDKKANVNLDDEAIMSYWVNGNKTSKPNLNITISANEISRHNRVREVLSQVFSLS